METRSWIAACGALSLHVVVIAAAMSIAGPDKVRDMVRPLTVRLLEPPRPLPAAPKALPRPPAPEPAPPVRPVEPPPPPPKPEPPPPKPEPPPPKPKPVMKPKPVRKPSATPRPKPVAAPIEAPSRPAAIATTPAPAPDTTSSRPAEQPRAVAASAAPPPPRPPVAVAPRIDASWSGNEPPVYPAMARRLGHQGAVTLDVHVGTRGQVLEVRLTQSSGSKLLDRTAIETVKKWKFQPATEDGTPVAAWYTNWKWVFKLEN